MKIQRTFLTLFIALVIIGSAIYIHAVRPQSNPSSMNSTQTQPNPDFKLITTSLPSANWTTPVPSTEQTLYGNLTGQAATGQITSQQTSMNQFEDVNAITAQGYKKDINLDAAGPGSTVWGYKKTENGKTQVIILFYKTQGTTNPNQPIQFNCPCKIDLKVFVSDPFNEK